MINGEEPMHVFVLKLWCKEHMAAPDPDRPRKGLFSATGDYLWYAFSDGTDQYKNLYPNLDLRHKVRFPVCSLHLFHLMFFVVSISACVPQVYTAVPGSSSCYEFQSRFEAPSSILSRRLPCRCEPCRLQQQGEPVDFNHCVLTTEAGDWKTTGVTLKTVLSSAATRLKKSTAKERRAKANAAKVARIAAQMAAFQGDLELAPNTEAAVAAAERTEGAEDFAAAYGAEDARQVAISRGETSLYRQADRESSSDEEVDGDDT